MSQIELVNYPSGAVGMNVPNEAGRMLPLLDGRTGAPADLSDEISTGRASGSTQAVLFRIAAGCGITGQPLREAPRPHQERYFTW